MSYPEVINFPAQTEPQSPNESPKRSGSVRKAAWFVGALILVLLIAGAVTIASKFGEKNTLAAETERLAVPSVSVIHPTQEQSHEELILPATVQAYKESPIYARTNGYLLRWYKDIGSHVNKGDLLADIDTPEVDQELLQTRATRQQIEAQLGLAKSSAERWQNLRKSDSVDDITLERAAELLVERRQKAPVKKRATKKKATKKKAAAKKKATAAKKTAKKQTS